MKTLILINLIIATWLLPLYGQNPDSILSGTFTDSRDGQGYKWVKIGAQTWMAENLKFKADSGAICYNNNLVNCDFYGALYSWEVAQIVCPEGWSLPSDEQWGMLEWELGIEPSEILVSGRRGSDIAHLVKSRFGWPSAEGASDKYGFSILPAGYYKNKVFSHFGNSAFFWTSSGQDSSNLKKRAWSRTFLPTDNRIGRYPMNQSTYMSVRCVKVGPAQVFRFPVREQVSKPINIYVEESRKFHLGFSVGLNVVGFKVIPEEGYEYSVGHNPGINLNLIADYRLGDSFNFRILPGIQFLQRDLTVINNPNPATRPYWIESVFVDLPMLLKYHFKRKLNRSPYFIGGFAPRFDLVGSQLEGWTPIVPMIKAFDFYPELGVGVDFYLSRTKVALELKFSHGLLDVSLNPMNPGLSLYTFGIRKLYSRMAVLSFHVE